MNQPTRRTLLCSIAGAAALSGCSESTESPNDSGQFEQASVEDQQLVITVSESLDAEAISVVNPDGESFAETDLSAGVTRVSFDIGTEYVPGEYRILATDGEETVAETTTVIEPDLEVVEIGVGANHLDRMPEALGVTREVECYIEIRNTGSGPEFIDKLQIKGGVPNPTELAEEESGIFNAQNGGGETEGILILGGGTRDIFSNSLPFWFDGDGVDCSPESKRKTANITISTEVSQDIERSPEVTYSASPEYDGCNIEINSSGD